MRCWEVTGRGASLSGPSRKRREWGIASRGSGAGFFERGLNWSHGRGRPLPAFFVRRSVLSGA